MPYPLGPTNPYFLPNVICSSALTNKSFPRADIENLSIYKDTEGSDLSFIVRICVCVYVCV